MPYGLLQGGDHGLFGDAELGGQTEGQGEGVLFSEGNVGDALMRRLGVVRGREINAPAATQKEGRRSAKRRPSREGRQWVQGGAGREKVRRPPIPRPGPP